MEAEAPAAHACTARELVRYFAGLGATGFGGPIALVGRMQSDLVEARRWYSAREYREGLALAQLAPGPLAAQLAMYLGWARGGSLLSALVGIAFVLPSFLIVLALAFAYRELGGLAWMREAFYGLGAAVIAVVARSAVKLTRLTLERDPLHWTLFALSLAATAWTESEIVWVLVGAGLVALLARGGPGLLGRGARPLGLALPPLLFASAAGQAGGATLPAIAWYFGQAGAFVFGSGLAIVPFLHGGVVRELGWLDERQFLDAVAVAMITPGPVVITVAFIGFLVAGTAGAATAALATFLPCYLLTVIPAPHFRRVQQSRAVAAFVGGVTAATTGAIAGAVFVLGRRAIVDWTTAAILLAALLACWRLPRLPEPLLLFAAGCAGVLALR